MLLRDYERKRARAMRHFHVLRRSVERTTNVHREAVRGEFDSDASKYVFDVPLEPANPKWTVVLGDFLYNTRASLDYLITALVRSTGNQEHTGNQFPIYTINRISWSQIDQWWETDPEGKIGRQLDNTPPATKAALKTLQPFFGVPRENPTTHPLFVLNLMNNRDKHRRLNLLAQVAEYGFVDGLGKPMFHGITTHGRITEAYEGDTYTVNLGVSAEYTNMDVHLVPTYDVGLHEPPELVGSLIETLTGINEFIDRRVLPTVKALL